MIEPRVTLILCLNFVLACQGQRTEPKAPSSAQSADQTAASRAASDASEGKEYRPEVVRGTIIHATLLEETTETNSAKVSLGISIRYQGTQVNSDAERFKLSFTASSYGNAVVTSREESSAGNYDRIITVQGSNAKEIRDEFSKIGMYVTIIDKVKNGSTSLNTTLAVALANSTDSSQTD